MELAEGSRAHQPQAGHVRAHMHAHTCTLGVVGERKLVRWRRTLCFAAKA